MRLIIRRNTQNKKNEMGELKNKELNKNIINRMKIKNQMLWQIHRIRKTSKKL